MPGSSTTPGRLDARFHAPTRVAFRIRNGVGTRDKNLCEAQWLACVLLYRRFASALTGDCARLEADVVRSGRTEARSGLRMMPTSPRSPLSFRTAGFCTAGRLAFQTGPSQDIAHLKLAPGMRWSVSGLRPSFVRLVTSAMAPL